MASYLSRYLLHAGTRSHHRPDVLIMAEQIRRIILLLQGRQPPVIRPIGGLDALRTLLGLDAHLGDVNPAAAEGLHHLRQIAGPADVLSICRRVKPTRQAAPLVQRLSV